MGLWVCGVHAQRELYVCMYMQDLKWIDWYGFLKMNKDLMNMASVCLGVVCRNITTKLVVQFAQTWNPFLIEEYPVSHVFSSTYSSLSEIYYAHTVLIKVTVQDSSARL